MDEHLTEAVDSLYAHEYFLCIYGVILWYLLWATIEKRIAVKNKTKLLFKNWWKLNRLDIITTFAIAPLVVAFDDEIILFYNDFVENDIQLGKLVYLSAGPVFNIALRFITGFKKT